MAGADTERWQHHYEPAVGERLVIELRRCLPWLEAALDEDAHGSTIHDVVERLLHHDGFELWPGQESAVVTELYKGVLTCWLAGGLLEELEAMAPHIKEKARRDGVSRIMIWGRRGWERTFLRGIGFEPRWTVMVQEL